MEISDLKKSDLKLLVDSVKYKGCIVTGGECKVGCKFCYLKESKPIANLIPLNIPFISRNDFNRALLVARKFNQKEVSLGDGVDLISSEPFIHPLIYEFIEDLESSHHIDKISITTSGLYIKEEKYNFLSRCKKIEWSISCSSLTEQGRERVVLTKNCKQLIDFLSFLHQQRWNFVDSLQLVIYSLKYFMEDLRIIRDRFPKFLNRIYIRELAYNKFFSSQAKSIIKHTRREFKKVLTYCNKDKISISWDDNRPHEDFDLKYNFDSFRFRVNKFIQDINNCIVCNLKENFKAPLICISSSCFYILPRIKDKVILPNFKKSYLEVKNITLGGTYTCYGLLTINDFIHSFKKINLKDYDAIFLNGLFLNKDNLDLARKHISALKKIVKLPIIVMNTAMNHSRI
jgi:hypothetical protein